MKNRRFKFPILRGALIYFILFIASFQTVLDIPNLSYLSRRVHVLEKINLNQVIPLNAFLHYYPHNLNLT